MSEECICLLLFLILSFIADLCVCSSWWRLDTMVCVVWLLSDLWSWNADSNPRLHQPPTSEQRLWLSWAGEWDKRLSLCPLSWSVSTFIAISHHVVLVLHTCSIQSSGLLLSLMAMFADDLCPWSPWSPCSQSCGAGSVSRHRMCLCEPAGDATCLPEVEAERNRQENQLCYKQPCPSK